MTNGRAETLRILANAFDELEQLRCRLRDDSEHVMHAMDAARADERAAVVTWLKRDSLQEDRTYEQMVLMGWIAQEIERGEHRREREPLEDDSIEYRDIGKED